MKIQERIKILSKASDLAYEMIKALIFSRKIKAGEQLKEEELAIQCGVSRTPVRDALVRLEAEFLVEKRDNQRSFVADPSREDIDDLFTLRAMLEGHAASRAAQRATPEFIEKLKSSLEIHGKSRDVGDFLEHNSIFHKLILDAAGSQRLVGMLERLISQPVVQHTAYAYDEGQISRSIHEHEELLQAIEQGDAEWARAVMTGHIRRAFHVYKDTRAKLALVDAPEGNVA